MAKIEWSVLLDTIAEVWNQISVQFDVFVEAWNQISVQTEQVKAQTSNTSCKYYRPPKNQYLKNKTYCSYKVEPRVQKHLPYQRRIY